MKVIELYRLLGDLPPTSDVVFDDGETLRDMEIDPISPTEPLVVFRIEK
jgi:hypothetical protein